MTPRLSAALFILCASLFGACGIAGAAAAAHGADPRLVAIAAAILLVHAPALLALAALDRSLLRFRTLAGGLLIVGTAMFSGDLVLRHVFGAPLFAMAAPGGGILMVAGWLVVAVGGIVSVSSVGARD